jgi:hypothetical protein
MPLWTMQSRTFIAVPLIPIGVSWVPVLGQFGFFLLLLALGLRFYRPQNPIFQVFAVLTLALLIVLDVHRLQVWVWFYILWFCFFEHLCERGFLLLCACMYAWAAIHKINIHFVSEVVPEWQVAMKLPGEVAKYTIAAMVIVAEALLAVCLAFFSSRRGTLILAWAFHIGILLVLVLGGQWNTVVWPWNILLPFGITLSWLSTRRQVNDVRTLQNPQKWRLGFGLSFAGVFPLFYAFGICPYTLSWMMYSGLHPELTLAAQSDFGQQMSNKVAQKVFTIEKETFLVLDDWTFAEANVPPFQSDFTFRAHANHWCAGGYGENRCSYLLINHVFEKNNDSFQKTECPPNTDAFPLIGSTR